MNAYRALLIEDNPGDVRLVREMLTGETHVRVSLDYVPTLADALRALDRELFDVVLIDLGLPDSEGIETFKRLHAIHPNLPTIVLTGNNDVDLARRSVQAGAQDYLVKGEITGSPLVRAIHYAIERNRSEEAVRASERLYRSIVENTIEGVWITDAETQTTFVNAPMAAMLGCSVDEMLRRPVTDFMDAQGMMEMAEGVRRRRAGVSERYEFKFIRTDGTAVWTLMSVTPLMSEHGHYEGALAVVSDITQRRAAEEVRRSLAAIVEGSHDGIFRTTSDGIVRGWNRGAERIYGYAAAEIIGRHVSVLAPPERQAEVAALIEALRGGAAIEGIETVRLTKDGHRINVSLTVSPLHDDRGVVVGFATIARDITDRKVVEERFRAAAESMSDVIFEWDLAETVTWFGDIDALTGHPQGGYPRTLRGWTATLHPDDRDRVIDALIHDVDGKEPYRAEYRIRKNDGSYAVWIARGVVIRDDRGEPQRMVGSVTDITARRQAEDALRASEAKYRTLIGSIPDVTWTADAAGNPTFFSPNAVALFGYTAEEMCAGGRTGRLEHIHPADFQRVVAAYASLFERAETLDLEYRMRRKDGVEIWVHERSVTTDESTFAGICSDISKRKDAEEELHRVASDRELLLESTGDGFYAVDRDGRCTMTNRETTILTGYSREELIGSRIHDVVHHHYSDTSPYPVESCPIYQVFRSGSQARVTDEVFWRKDDRSFPVEYVSSPIVDGGVVRGAVVRFSDVTERRKLERRLQQISRVSSLGRMAATIAHEFNNVLMGIQPFAEVIRRRAGGNEMLERSATQILNSVNRGRTITQDIMRMTRPAEPSLQAVDMTVWLEQIAAEIRAIVSERIVVDVIVPPPNTLFAHCDPAQMQQVITNLSMNARDAMSQPGTLTLSAEKTCDGVRLCVSDTGCGIDADALPFIFEPLFTTKKSGTGLGLAVAQQIVIRNGGAICVESVVGEGTHFRIDIPEAAPAESPQSEGGRVAATRTDVRRVLIVEDDSAVADGLRSILQEEGIETRLIALGAQAMDAAAAFAPDAVLIDISLPDISGLDVYEQIAARWPELAVIFSTGHADESRLPRTEGDHLAFLRKPYSAGTLLSKLRQVTQHAQAR